MIESKTLVDKIVEGCQEKKANDIAIINMSEISGAICNYFVICDGSSPTQVSAIAEEVEDHVRKTIKDKPIRINKNTEGTWIGIDYGNVIVHVMMPETREYYSIEQFWEDGVIEKIPNIY